MSILVTGITGFAGGHLAEALLAHGDTQVFGVSRRGEWPTGLRHLADGIELYPCDVSDRDGSAAILRHTNPEQIYHMAGYAHAGRSFQESEDAWTGNMTATRRFYEAISSWGGRPRILFVSSGLVYGDAGTVGQLVDESRSLRPASPYAASKAAADLLSSWFVPPLDIVRVRPFNHIGPRQSPEYAVANFARQIAAIEQGRLPPVAQTGNLNSRRDLTDVRDMVEAYILLMNLGRSGDVYNAGSGVTYVMQEVLDRLIALARVRVEVRQQPERIRAVEPVVYGADTTKLRRQTGWEPRFSLDQTLADTLEYWRSVS